MKNNNKKYLIAAILLSVISGVTGSIILANILAIFGLFISFYIIKEVIGNPSNMVSCLKLSAFALISSTSSAWVISEYYSNLSKSNIENVISKSIGVSVGFYILAWSYVIIFALILYIFSENTKLKRFELKVYHKIINIDIKFNQIRNFVILICVIEIIELFFGIITYRSYNLAGYAEGVLAWYIPLLEFMYLAQIPINALFINKISSRWSLQDVIIILTSISLTIFIAFTKGRAAIIITVLFQIFWIHFFNLKIFTLKRLILIFIILYPIITTALYFNNFIRSSSAGGSTSFLQSDNIFSTIADNSSTFFGDNVVKDSQVDVYNENLAERPLLLAPLALALQVDFSKQNFLLGLNLRNSFIWSLPGNIINKRAYPVAEDLINEFYPFGFEDTSDSVSLYAYLDFFIFGLLIYPYLIYLTWKFIIYICSLRKVSPLLAVIIIMISINFLGYKLNEASVVEWFSSVRNLIFFSYLYYFVSYIFFKNKY